MPLTCDFYQTGPNEWQCDVHGTVVTAPAEPAFCYPPEPDADTLADGEARFEYFRIVEAA